MIKDSMNIFNLTTLDISGLNCEKSELLPLLDYDFKTNILLTNIFSLNIYNVINFLEKGLSPKDFLVEINPQNLAETVLFQKTFLSGDFKKKNQTTLPPFFNEEKNTNTLNYLVYLAFLLDSHYLKTDLFKINAFQLEIVRIIELFDKYNCLDIVDNNGYSFNDYLIKYPSFSFLSLLHEKSLINYKFNKYKQSDMLEKFSKNVHSLINNNHLIYVLGEKNRINEETKNVNYLFSCNFPDVYDRNNATFINNLETIINNISALSNKIIMRNDIKDINTQLKKTKEIVKF